jgi:hypothetical protein
LTGSCKKLGRKLYEVPVGFKWFVPGLFDGSCCFGGEESAGASFLRRDGTVWTTDKDGLIMDLLAAEITARTGKDPGEHYRELTAQFGTPYYTRMDAPATPEQKARLRTLTPEAVGAQTLAGEPIVAQTDARSRRQRPDRWFESGDRERLVCGAALGHGKHLQDLRGELQEPGASRRHPERGRRNCESCPECLERPNVTGASIGIPPFPSDYRASGLLLHVTSLPSRYGIGDLGPAALAWVDRLNRPAKAGGRRCRWGPPVMAIHPISPCAHSPGTRW